MHNEVFETMSSLDDIEGEMKSAEDAARKAEEALRAFRLEHDIHSFDSEYAAVLAYLKELERQLLYAKGDARQARSRMCLCLCPCLCSCLCMVAHACAPPHSVDT